MVDASAARTPTPMHWSRWGDPARAAPLPQAARALVEATFGRHPSTGVELAQVSLPPCGLPDRLLSGLAALLGPDHVRTDHESRVRHAVGRSTPDLLGLRGGRLDTAPDVVVRPGDHGEVQALVDWCSEHRVGLVPFGGGTSVVGGLSARRGGLAGVVAADLARLSGITDVDPVAMTAVLEAGLRGPQAEQLLDEHGLTLGHLPQSFEYATVGGFAATRSSGQASARYGRFDDLVVGLRVATPQGTLELGSAPASAAGPDLRQVVLGSEGAFGVITAVRCRVRRRPETSSHEGWRFESFEAGTAAVRELAQRRLMPAVVRLSDETETALNLAQPDEVGEDAADGCLMVVGHEADRSTLARHRAEVADVLTAAGGQDLGPGPGEAWLRGRFDGPYLRDALLDAGVLVETLETAAFWSDVPRVYGAVRAALEEALDEEGRPVLALCHVSHVYETGCSLYFTVAAAGGADPVGRWRMAKTAASEAITDAGATITHHHAVGRDHRPWLSREIGPVGVAVLRGIKHSLDPHGVLNPGVLVPEEPDRTDTGGQDEDVPTPPASS